MNRLKAVIVSQRHSGGFAAIEATSGDYLFRLLVIEEKQTRKSGEEVYLLIKESEIAIAKSKITDISLSNRFECLVREVAMGEILCELTLEFNSNVICSIITSESADRLGVKAGDTVYALIKANEIYLENIA